MEDTPVYYASSTLLHALLPDAIIGSVVLTHPKERVLVKGRVEQLRPWPAAGDLKLGHARLEVVGRMVGCTDCPGKIW